MESNNGNNSFIMKDVYEFLGKLFNVTDKITTSMGNNAIRIKITNSIGRKVSKAKLAVNIKDRSTLGWYDEVLDLCLIPVNGNEFILKKGCASNKPIRPLEATFVD